HPLLSVSHVAYGPPPRPSLLLGGGGSRGFESAHRRWREGQMPRRVAGSLLSVARTCSFRSVLSVSYHFSLAEPGTRSLTNVEGGRQGPGARVRATCRHGRATSRSTPGAACRIRGGLR